MKKLLLTLTIAASSLFVNAQRTIDWSTEDILGVDTIFSQASGTPIPFTLVMKNNGTDTAFAGDSVFYQYVLTAGTQLIAAYPSASTLAVRAIADTIAPGDTMHVSVSITLNSNISASARVQSNAITHIINRSKGLTFEAAPGNTNNTSSKTTVWMDIKGWGVGLAEELKNAGSTLNVYPNPASDMLNFSINYNKAAKVEVMDITGRVIETVNFDMNNASVNVSNYNAGLYLYRVLTNDNKVIKAGKVTVNN